MPAALRVAALYDFHANVPALEAALAEVDRVSVDRIVIGGDVGAGSAAGRDNRAKTGARRPGRVSCAATAIVG
jgi:Icc-related predicted phosphoesterase